MCVLLQIGAMSFGVALMQKTEAMDFDSIVLDVVSLEREGGNRRYFDRMRVHCS